MLSDITQEQIETLNAQRARLQPLAALVGVAYDEADYRLMNALDVLADARDARGARAAAEGPGSPAPATGVGFVVAQRMLERRGGGGSVARPVEPAGLQAALVRPGVVTVGNQVCARMAARRLGVNVPEWALG